MTVWEFRRRVRERRPRMEGGCCPLGAAMDWARQPTPTWASMELELPWGYALGVIGGYDNSTPATSLPESEVFDRGERFGARMRIVRALKGWL